MRRFCSRSRWEPWERIKYQSKPKKKNRLKKLRKKGILLAWEWINKGKINNTEENNEFKTGTTSE